MTLSEIHLMHPDHNFRDHTTGEEHDALRSKLFGPLLLSLRCNRILYSEAGFLCIAKVEDVNLCKTGFEALAVTVVDFAEGSNPQGRPKSPPVLKFGANWGMLTSSPLKLFARYAGWRLYPDSEIVECFAKILADEGQVAAYSYLTNIEKRSS